VGSREATGLLQFFSIDSTPETRYPKKLGRTGSAQEAKMIFRFSYFCFFGFWGGFHFSKPACGAK
jgi:hypothetical protein